MNPRAPAALALAGADLAPERVLRRVTRRRAHRAQLVGTTRPREFPSWAFSTAAAIEGSRGACSRALARDVPARYRGALVRVALGVERRRPDDFSSRRSRRIVALWVVLWKLSHRARRWGMARVVEGFTAVQLAGLFTNAHDGRRATRSALSATSWGRHRRAPDDCGILTALTRGMPREKPLVVASQPPEDRADPRFVGRPRLVRLRQPSGAIVETEIRFAFAVYHFRELGTYGQGLARPPPD